MSQSCRHANLCCGTPLLVLVWAPTSDLSLMPASAPWVVFLFIPQFFFLICIYCSGGKLVGGYLPDDCIRHAIKVDLNDTRCWALGVVLVRVSMHQTAVENCAGGKLVAGHLPDDQIGHAIRVDLNSTSVGCLGLNYAGGKLMVACLESSPSLQLVWCNATILQPIAKLPAVRIESI
ncbi:hypothetical protein B0H14DRAFT_2604436 [Mycena olivaceomarginata]|nr:hypothetical protein B0H14DRAFT_2604436 [Mycena olivaceomarginata]